VLLVMASNVRISLFLVILMMEGLHKLLGNYRVAAQLVVSRAVLSSTELVNHKSIESVMPRIYIANLQQHHCKICGFHGGHYEEWCLLGCYAAWTL
jgi:hypothetical protein